MYDSIIKGIHFSYLKSCLNLLLPKIYEKSIKTKQPLLFFTPAHLFPFFSLFVGDTNCDSHCVATCSVFPDTEVRSLTIIHSLVARRLSPEQVLSYTHLESRKLRQKQQSLLILILIISSYRQSRVASLLFISMYRSVENG